MSESKSEQKVEGLLSGWMTKRGHFFKTWRKRWFVLYPFRVSYYTDQDRVHMKGTYLLDQNSYVERIADNYFYGRKFVFKLHARGTDNELFMSAESSAISMEEWMSSIFHAIQSLKSANTMTVEPKPLFPPKSFTSEKCNGSQPDTKDVSSNIVLSSQELCLCKYCFNSLTSDQFDRRDNIVSYTPVDAMAHKLDCIRRKAFNDLHQKVGTFEQTQPSHAEQSSIESLSAEIDGEWFV